MRAIWYGALIGARLFSAGAWPLAACSWVCMGLGYAGGTYVLGCGTIGWYISTPCGDGSPAAIPRITEVGTGLTGPVVTGWPLSKLAAFGLYAPVRSPAGIEVGKARCASGLRLPVIAGGR